MAAITAAVVGASIMAYGAAAQGDAALAAGQINAQNAEYNADLVKKRSIEDERQFRLSFQRDNASNVAAIGASGIRSDEGSPLEVLRQNASMMEQDATKIKLNARNEADSYSRQANYARFSAGAAAQGASFSAASNLLSGAGKAYDVSNRSTGGTRPAGGS